MDLGRTFREYRRIVKIARKPTRKEFLNTLKVTSIGILVIGAVGFVIQSIFTAINVV